MAGGYDGADWTLDGFREVGCAVCGSIWCASLMAGESEWLPTKSETCRSFFVLLFFIICFITCLLACFTSLFILSFPFPRYTPL